MYPGVLAVSKRKYMYAVLLLAHKAVATSKRSRARTEALRPREAARRQRPARIGQDGREPAAAPGAQVDKGTAQVEVEAPQSEPTPAATKELITTLLAQLSPEKLVELLKGAG